MSSRIIKLSAVYLLGVLIVFGVGCEKSSQDTQQIQETQAKEAVMKTHASGTFEVKLNPRAPDDKSEDATIGRMSIDKQYHGDLEGIGKGQMLSAMTAVKGSGVYVAIEKVNGKLHGRSGTFVLQHSGTMTRGAPQLTITVVPDSGTDQLVGLAGKMAITIADGKHSYDFEYTLAEVP